MMNRNWIKIGDYITAFREGNYLELRVNDNLVFTNEQIFNELYYFYSEWSYLVRLFVEDNAQKFLQLYTDYVKSVGYNYFRMNDALTREYNPLNNYEMIESGADGRKISDRTFSDNNNNLRGVKESDTTDVTTGSVENDFYNNAFNSDVSSAGTHVSREVSTNNNLTVTHTKENTESETSADGKVTFTNFDEINKEYNTNERTESNKNDVEISYKVSTPDGARQTVITGNTFTEGTMHEFTRSGNIGVTTSAQMIQGELEMRKTNLMKDFVRGFILRYCTFTGFEEE